MKSYLTLAFILLAWSCQAPAVGNHYATLKWNPVTTYVGGSPISTSVVYNIYKSSNGTNFVLTASDLALSTTQWIDSSVIPNKTYWYYVTAFDTRTSVESTASNTLQLTIP